MGTVTIVRPDAETTDDLEEISLGKGGKVELSWLQETIGGWITPVKVRHNGKAATLVVDEEGLVKCLDPNPVASQIAGQPIVGTAVLLVGVRL